MSSVTTTAIRPEAELLLLCARTSMDPERAERVRALLAGRVDWEYLLATARRHKTMPLLYRHLSATCPEAVPEAVLDRLRAHFRGNNMRNLFLTGELLRLLDALQAHGVSAIPFKGPVLAASVYENLALRDFIDLDMLVHKRDVTKARELLVSLGYQPQYLLTRAQEEVFLQYEREYTFTHDSKGSVVEVHWEVASKAFPFSLDTERLWERLGPTRLGSDTIMTFSPEDLLSILCAHGAAHLWGRLGWVCDVAELVRAHAEMDWEQIIARARRSGSQRILLLGLFLASDLLGASLPEEVSERLRADPSTKALARQVSERLFWESEDPRRAFDEEAHFQPLHLRMMERWRDRVGYCLRQATAPILKDWALRPLPASLFPIYRILRPIRLAGKYGQRFLNRSSR